MNKLTLSAAACSLILCGCATKKEQQSVVPELIQTPERVIGNGPVKALPRAVVYRMAGDATADNVPVQLDANGNIVSYPDPRDVRGAEPVALGDGWLLDRRGISEQSVFTRYTYPEYAALQAPPTLAELREAIIPGARPVDIHRLDMTPSQAAADTATVKAAIAAFTR